MQWGFTSIQKPAFNKQVSRKQRGLLKLQHFLLIFGLPLLLVSMVTGTSLDRKANQKLH